MSQSAPGIPPARGRGRRNRQNRPNPPAPAPNPPNPAPRQAFRQQRRTTVRNQDRNSTNTRIMTHRPDNSEAALTASLETFAASFATAGDARILPTPTPNYANAMAFHKVISVAGDSGTFSGVKNRMFEIDPYDPWEKGIKITEEVGMTEAVGQAQGTLSNSRDFTIRGVMSFPMSVTGQDPSGNTVVIETELYETDEDITAWLSNGRTLANHYWAFSEIVFNSLGSPNIQPENHRTVVTIDDQAIPTNPSSTAEVFDGANWVDIPGNDVSFAKSGSDNIWTTTFGANAGTQVVGKVRVLLTLNNPEHLGTVRSASVSTYLENVRLSKTSSTVLPLCASSDVAEVKSVWDNSSHVRLGAVAVWLQPTAASLTNGGSVLMAQVLKSTRHSQSPSLAFTQLSELPDRVYTGKFKDGTYGWYNADRVRDLEFKPVEEFFPTSHSASKLVIIVRPENLGGAGQSYLFKINCNYNYRWQSRIFRPVMTPCSWELLQRLLVVNSAYCNVGCNPVHVDKIRKLARDFAQNPENRRIAKDALRLITPGLKGLADGAASTFIPGYDIMKAVVKPYI